MERTQQNPYGLVSSVEQDEIREIAAKHGARNVRVFGSVARGDARPDSDVDFLVDMEPGRTLLDVVTEYGLKLRTRDRILKEAELS